MAAQLLISVNIVRFGDLWYSFEINSEIRLTCYRIVKTKCSDWLIRLSARQCTWRYSALTLSADWKWAHEEAR